jgi:hypothetical protein
MSGNPNLTWDIIRSKHTWSFNWLAISENPNVCMDVIKDNPDKPWDWHGISANPNITYQFVVDNLDKIDWGILSANNFGYDEYFQSEAYRRRQTKRMHDRVHEELIRVACTPRRVLQWDEPGHPFYELSQSDIDRLF